MNELALFAGAGGGILAGQLLGWKTVCAVEWEAYPASVLMQRQNEGILPAFPIWDDVQTFDGKPWKGIIDVISGGFPCQDISVAGKGAGIDGERSGMWKEMHRVICEVDPEFVYVENSSALVIRGLGTVLRDLATIGFDAKWTVLSCADAGGVHLRKRIWIVATNNRKKRRERVKQKTLPRLKRLPWGKDVRSVEDLRNRPDLPKPLIRRVNHDVAFGVDRLAATGNGQVPRVAALAWRILTS